MNRPKKTAHRVDDADLPEALREPSGSAASLGGPPKSFRQSSCHRTTCPFRQPLFMISEGVREGFAGKSSVERGMEDLGDARIRCLERDATF